MEEDKKKKKNNKKKKNKQASNPIESVTLDARESTSDSQNHVLEIAKNNKGQVPGIIDAPNDVGGHVDGDRDGHHANGTEGKYVAESEKQYWLDKEANFQAKIKELQAEKDAQIHKESVLEQRINQLLMEKVENSRKEDCEKEKIKQLVEEKNASMQSEAILKEKLIQLEKEKEVLFQKEGSLEQKIQQLQGEISAQLHKEASLEMEILQLKGEKDSWAQKENSAKESIASLTNENTNLRDQVIELEQSGERLLEETWHLKETISRLQLQISNLESTAGFPHSSMNNKTSEDGDANYKIEAARALVEKLVAENSELVEKVNELYVELDQRGVRSEHSADSAPGAVTAQFVDIADGSTLMPHLVAVGADDKHRTDMTTDSIHEAGKMISISGSTQSLEDVIIEDQRNGELLNVNGSPGLANSSEIIEVDEIVQIPLDENEIVKETNLEVSQYDNEKTDVPLADAPLIGAPFRLMSFVARYVSGADLVNKNNGK